MSQLGGSFAGGVRGVGTGRVEPDRGPLGRGGFDGGWRRGYLGWIYLEDAELTLSWGGTRGGAQRTFGVAWAGLAGSDQLAGKLDEICGQRYRRAGGLFKEGRFAEGDLFIEQAGFGFIAVLLLPGQVTVAGGGLRGEAMMRCA